MLTHVHTHTHTHTQEKAKTNPPEVQKGGFAGIKIPRKGDPARIPKKEGGGALPRIPKKGETPTAGGEKVRG